MGLLCAPGCTDEAHDVSVGTPTLAHPVGDPLYTVQSRPGGAAGLSELSLPRLATDFALF